MPAIRPETDDPAAHNGHARPLYPFLNRETNEVRFDVAPGASEPWRWPTWRSVLAALICVAVCATFAYLALRR